MQKVILVVMTGFLLFSFVNPGFSATTQVDALIEKLVEKGILTRKEGIALKAEIAADEKIVMGEQIKQHTLDTSYKFGKGVTIESPDKEFKATLGTRVQFRYTGEDKESGTDTSSFHIPRAKVYVSGFVFKPQLHYKIQGNFKSGKDGQFRLEDYYFDWKEWEFLNLRFGQYKVPFNRQELTSSGKLQFVDRAITNSEFSLGRDIGLMAHGKLPILADKFSYNLGIFNGEGANRSVNDNTGMLYATRLNLGLLGKYDYSESDIKNSKEPQLAVGMAYGFEDNEISGSTKRDVHNLTADAGLKWRGLSFQAEYFYRQRKNVASGADTISDGVVGQVGYFLIPEHVELAGRYALVDPSRSATRDQKKEWAAGLNYFIKGHDLKLQVDYSRLKTESTSGDRDDDRIRMQLQVVF